MLKFVALAGAAAALDTEAPVISLDFEAAGQNDRQPYKLVHRIEHTKATNQHGESVTSYQDFSVRCAAGAADHSNCPAPKATAYDHHEGNLPACSTTNPSTEACLSTRLYLVNSKPAAVGGVEQPDTPCTNEATCIKTAVDYSVRSTYLYKFDAKDKSGNRAQQVVFALILDDLHAPQIYYQGDDSSCAKAWDNRSGDCTDESCERTCFPVLANQQVIEAASDWVLPSNSKAIDNIDGDVVSTLLYKIEFLNGKTGVFTPMSSTKDKCAISKTNDCYVPYSTAKTIIDTTRVCHHHETTFDHTRNNKCEETPSCEYRVTLKANDFAQIYGHDGANNVRTHAVSLIVKDTRKPVTQIQGADPMQVECNAVNTNYNYGEKNSKGTFSKISEYNYGSSACNADGSHDFCASGADVLDLQDTVAFGRNIEYKVTYSGTSTQGDHGLNKKTTTSTFSARHAPLPISKVGAYKVHFNAKDHSCNDADEVTRDVAVIDTTKPVIKLVGKQTVFIEDGTSKDKAIDAGKSWNKLESHSTGVVCEDMCSKKDLRITSHWSPSTWEPKSSGTASGKGFGPGTYVQTFRCFDHEGNSAEVARTYVVEDNGQPTIKLNGKAKVTLEASKDAEYTDEGATCSDYSDGQIDHQVVIHGDVVNYRVPGTYIIRFDCEDSSGNDADRRERTVVIEDTECPIVKLFGEPTTTVEAGFPYEDLAATATDTLDGDVTSKIVNAGGPGVAHFNYETSCKAIKSISPSAANGNYNVLVTIGGHHQFLPVYCDMSTQSTFFIHKGHKLFHDDIKESEMIVPYGTHQGACGTYGLKMASFSSATAENNAVLYAKNLEAGRCADCVVGASKVNGLWKFSKTEKTTAYFCMPKTDKAGGTEKYSAAEKAAIKKSATESIASQKGQFVMTYKVKDRAGNGWGSAGCNGNSACCSLSMKKRTVYVVDTLPPVITVTLKGKLIHKSYGGQRGINAVANPAGFASGDKHFHAAGLGHKANLISGNPFLSAAEHKNGLSNDVSFMAEQTSSANGWIIGAVASAVAGVALMGYSMKSTTSTTVPV